MTLIYRNPLSLLLIHQTARNPGACCPAGSSSGGHMVIRIRGRRWQYLPKSFLPEPGFAFRGLPCHGFTCPATNDPAWYRLWQTKSPGYPDERRFIASISSAVASDR